MKAILVEQIAQIKKTHDILELKQLLLNNRIEIELSDDECDFLNSIYLPSKYPLGSILAKYEPDEKTCRQGIKITKKAVQDADWIIKRGKTD